jgi:hypothetical protein
MERSRGGLHGGFDHEGLVQAPIEIQKAEPQLVLE